MLEAVDDERNVTSCRCSRTVMRRTLPTNLAVDIHLIGEDPFLGPVELTGEALGITVERTRASVR